MVDAPDRIWIKGTVINNGPATLIRHTDPHDPTFTEYVRRDLLTREAVAGIVKPLVDIAYRSGASRDEGVDHMPAVRQILALLDPKEPT